MKTGELDEANTIAAAKRKRYHHHMMARWHARQGEEAEKLASNAIGKNPDDVKHWESKADYHYKRANKHDKAWDKADDIVSASLGESEGLDEVRFMWGKQAQEPEKRKAEDWLSDMSTHMKKARAETMKAGAIPDYVKGQERRSQIRAHTIMAQLHKKNAGRALAWYLRQNPGQAAAIAAKKALGESVTAQSVLSAFAQAHREKDPKKKKSMLDAANSLNKKWSDQPREPTVNSGPPSWASLERQRSEFVARTHAAKNRRPYSEGEVLEVAPPGREEQVKKLKKKFGVPGAYKIAWAQYSKKRGKLREQREKWWLRSEGFYEPWQTIYEKKPERHIPDDKKTDKKIEGDVANRARKMMGKRFPLKEDLQEKNMKKRLGSVLVQASEDDPSWHTHKKGTDVHRIRDEFFYRHGKTSADHAKRVSDQLNKAGIKHSVIAHGEHYKPFKGGASIAKSSHWWVDVSIPKTKKITESWPSGPGYKEPRSKWPKAKLPKSRAAVKKYVADREKEYGVDTERELAAGGSKRKRRDYGLAEKDENLQESVGHQMKLDAMREKREGRMLSHHKKMSDYHSYMADAMRYNVRSSGLLSPYGKQAAREMKKHMKKAVEHDNAYEEEWMRQKKEREGMKEESDYGKLSPKWKQKLARTNKYFEKRHNQIVSLHKAGHDQDTIAKKLNLHPAVVSASLGAERG